MIYEAGQIGPLEWILIGIGILWVAGFLRTKIYVPVVIKEKEKEEKKDEVRISPDVTVTRSAGKSDNEEFVPFEEVKE